MEFRWLSEVKRGSQGFQNLVKDLAEAGKGREGNWNEEKIIDYLERHSYDCLLALDGKKFAGFWAVNKDKESGIMKGFMVYVSPEHQGKGLSRALTVELAKRAHSEGFSHGQLGLGKGKISRVLASTQRKRKELGASGFSFNHKTGKVVFPKRKIRG